MGFRTQRAKMARSGRTENGGGRREQGGRRMVRERTLDVLSVEACWQVDINTVTLFCVYAL